MDLTEDLQERWRPSPEQIAAAEKMLAATPEQHVYTIHLLLNKEWGFWTEDVVVEYVPGVFNRRNVALDYLDRAAKEHYEATGQKVVGGFTSHSAGGQWAVFDDIVASYPKEES